MVGFYFDNAFQRINLYLCRKHFPLEALERSTLNHDWLTVLLLAVFLVLVVARKLYPQRFVDFSMLFATNKYLLLRGKEPEIIEPFNVLLFVVNVISVSLFIFLFYGTYTSGIARPQIFFLQIATGYTTFILLKFSLEKIIANILSLDEKMDYYMLYKLSYRNFLALVLLPVSIIFIYVWPPGLLAFYICLGVMLLLNLVVTVGIFRKNQQYIFSNWFYFILYLCALEIGPYYILYKLVTRA